jgi:hypothetical protein
VTRATFLISNDRHHVDMMSPVVKLLADGGGHRCRVVSLCELRGFRSPPDRFRFSNVEFVRVLPLHLRRSPSIGQTTGRAGDRALRGMARSLLWSTALRRRIESCLDAAADVVVLPNDAAFPFDRIAALLRARRTPFILVQEGIRFPLPGVTREEAYGRGGAAAIAAWGDSSATYFRGQGVAAQQIHLTGNPRFDELATIDWRGRGDRLRAELGVRGDVLLYMSNPIDDQGFCTSAEKLELFRRFAVEVAPLVAARDATLVVKLHGREDEAAYARIARAAPHSDRIIVAKHAPLYPLCAIARGAVVLASTVGLEALLFGVSLGVLEIPGAGFVHDYVQSGAAVGIRGDAALGPQVAALLDEPSEERRAATAAYIDRHLAGRGSAATHIAELVRRHGAGR